MKSRVLTLFAAMMFLWGALVLRAAYLQLVPDQRISQLKDRQFQTVVNLQSRRGAIVDRQGRELAISVTAYSLFADPKILQSKKQVSRQLAKILGVSPVPIYEKVKSAEKRFVWIARQLSREKYERIKALDIRGLSFVDEFKRVYPNENLLAKILGWVGSEGKGLEGLELAYDEDLRGQNKTISVRRDARGRPLLAEGMMFADNPDGSEIQLTVDSEIQHLLESQLSEAQLEYDADQAFGVVLDAQTSAIIAMASTPQYDANDAAKTDIEVRRIRTITDAFEPGSTMKTFALAGALQHGLIKPNTKYNTENGQMKVGDRIIREAEMDHNWSQLSVSEILAFSSNIGTTKIAFDLGAEKLRQTLMDFGFGSKLGIDLPGEAKGQMNPLPWNQHLLSNISFGQGVAATALQVANAYAVIANGGHLNRPYIVKSIRDAESGEEQKFSYKPVRRVLDAEVASAMRLMLTGATAPGSTGFNAKVDGFLVAGKTGTAQKVNPQGRGYLSNAYISSFAGFIPANDPRYVIYVAVDYPKRNSYYGSQVAAPIFSRIASYVARKEGLAPVLLSEKNIVPTQSEIRFERTPSLVSTATEILDWAKNDKITEMPDLKNKTLREVLQRMTGQNVKIKIVGQGLVAETVPAAGEVIEDDQKITIYLNNPSRSE